MPDTFVDWGAQGLSPGDSIDGWINDISNGEMIRVPGGTYNYSGATPGGHTDVFIFGDGHVHLDTGGDGISGNFEAQNGSTCLWMNMTMHGTMDPSGGDPKVRPLAESGSRLIMENFNRPDGSVDGAWQGYYSPSNHAGVAMFRNCETNFFGDNGLYQSSSTPDDGNGSLIVEGGLYRCNNVSNVRLAAGTQSAIRHVNTRADGRVTRINGSSNCRLIRIREAVDGAIIENNHMVVDDRDGGGLLFRVNDRADGSSGIVRNNRVYNDTSDDPFILQTAEDAWDGHGNHCIGPGNVTGAPSGWIECSDGSSPFDSCRQPAPRQKTSLPGARFVIMPKPGAGIEYRFDVEGLAEHVTNVGALSSDPVNDDVINNGDGTYTVEGAVSGGFADSFQCHGQIVNWSFSGANESDLFLWVDNTRVTSDDFENVAGGERDPGGIHAASAMPIQASDTAGTPSDSGRLTPVRARPIAIRVDDGALTAATAIPNARSFSGQLGTRELGGTMLGGPVSQPAARAPLLTPVLATPLTATERSRGAATAEATIPTNETQALRGVGPIAHDKPVSQNPTVEAVPTAAAIVALAEDDGSLVDVSVKPRLGHTLDFWWDDDIHWTEAHSENIDFADADEPALAEGETTGTLHLEDIPLEPGPVTATGFKANAAGTARTGMPAEKRAFAEPAIGGATGAEARTAPPAVVATGEAHAFHGRVNTALGIRPEAHATARAAAIPRGTNHTGVDPAPAAATGTEAAAAGSPKTQTESPVLARGVPTTADTEVAPLVSATAPAATATATEAPTELGPIVGSEPAVADATPRAHPLVTFGSGATGAVTANTDVEIPAGARVVLVVYEDTDDDGTPENAVAATLDDGHTSVTLTGFDVNLEAAYWPLVRLEMGTSGETPVVDSVTLTRPETA